MNAEEVYALLNKKIKKGGITCRPIKKLLGGLLRGTPLNITLNI